MYTYAYCFAKAEEDRVEIRVIENLLLEDIAKRDIRFTDKFDKHPDMAMGFLIQLKNCMQKNIFLMDMRH